MKALLTTARILVGVLFIFSGLVKANDPLGLSYKMQEFFQVWGLHTLNGYALTFALIMNVFEIVAGIAVLVGWRMRLFGWLLLLLIVFFTFLTGYAAYSGKITACGCFGDCIPLTPKQSFLKDVILLVLILFLLINHKKIRPVVSSKAAFAILIISTIAVSALQWYVMKYLPIVDCLPYKKGNDLLEQMKTPNGFIPDDYTYVFKYEKGGKQFEFNEDNLPEDIDSYAYIDTKQKLVKKGNDLKAKITDFNLVTENGTDTTKALLSTPGKYVLMFALQQPTKGIDEKLWNDIANRVPFYIVTADAATMRQQWKSQHILTCDGTVIKTAARVVPTYFVMQGAKVLGKFSYAESDKVLSLLDKK